MKTIAATLTLTIMFLSAGAFAGNNRQLSPPTTKVINANVTVIGKNGEWPFRNRITTDACSLARCIAI